MDVKSVYRFIGDRRRDLFVLAVLPTILCWAALWSIYPMTYFETMAVSSMTSPQTAQAAVYLVIYAGYVVVVLFKAFLYVGFAVAWHRYCLTNDQPVGFLASVRWRRQHWRYAFRLLIVAIAGYSGLNIVAPLFIPVLNIFIIGSPPGSATGTILAILVLIGLVLGASYFVARIALVFPAAAINDEDTGFRSSWQLTRERSLSFYGRLLLVVLPAVAIASLLQYVARSLVSPQAGYEAGYTVFAASSLVEQVCSFIGIALLVTALSLDYQNRPNMGTHT